MPLSKTVLGDAHSLTLDRLMAHAQNHVMMKNYRDAYILGVETLELREQGLRGEL